MGEAGGEGGEDFAELVFGKVAPAEAQQAFGEQQAGLVEPGVEVEGGAVGGDRLFGAAGEVVEETLQGVGRRLFGVALEEGRDLAGRLVHPVAGELGRRPRCSRSAAVAAAATGSPVPAAAGGTARAGREAACGRVSGVRAAPPPDRLPGA